MVFKICKTFGRGTKFVPKCYQSRGDIGIGILTFLLNWGSVRVCLGRSGNWCILVKKMKDDGLVFMIFLRKRVIFFWGGEVVFTAS